MTDRDAKLCDIACTIYMETVKAWLVDAGTGEKVWLPKSIVEIDDPNKETLWDNRAPKIATMPEWLAKEKGLL